MTQFQSLLADFQKLADPAHAVGVSRFFGATTKRISKELLLDESSMLRKQRKTEDSRHIEGDLFLGLYVPQVRVLSKQYKELPLADIQTLITSPIHEYRLLAVFILTIQYEKAIKQNNLGLQQEIIALYMTHKAYINNWDLVDLSAPRLLGRSILEAIIANEHTGSTDDGDRHRERKRGDPCEILHDLSHSTSLRDRRIAIISTFTLLRAGLYDDTLEIAETLLTDTHDLIHKAVGRMLREIGKRCKPVEDEFLKKHYKVMPRTMLRYAIEKYPEEERLRWLKGDM